MRPRGSTMMEVMMAGALFLLGSVGALTLLTQGALAQRRGMQPVTSNLQAQALLADYTMFGYQALSAGTFDAGVYLDAAGRSYARSLTVDADAGTSYAAFVVTARVESFRPGYPTPLVTTASTIVSLQPDGG